MMLLACVSYVSMQTTQTRGGAPVSRRGNMASNILPLPAPSLPLSFWGILACHTYLFKSTFPSKKLEAGSEIQ